MAIVRRARRDVALNVVVAVDVPEGGRGRVSGEAIEERACARPEVARDDVVRLQPVLDEVGVPAVLEGNWRVA